MCFDGGKIEFNAELCDIEPLMTWFNETDY